MSKLRIVSAENPSVVAEPDKALRPAPKIRTKSTTREQRRARATQRRRAKYRGGRRGI